MSKLQNFIDQIPRDELMVGLFAVVCIGTAIVASRAILSGRIRRKKLKSLSGAIDFEKHRRRKRILPRIRFGAINPMVWVVLFAVGALAYMSTVYIIPTSTLAPTLSRFELVGRVTHTRDGDTIEVNGTPVRFARLDCDELGTPAGERAKVRMRALVMGKVISCTLTGDRSYDRVIGSCYLSDGRQLSYVMVEEGYCTWWR